MTWFLSNAVNNVKTVAAVSATFLLKAATTVAQDVMSSTASADPTANNAGWSETTIGLGVAAVFAITGLGAYYCLRTGYTGAYVKERYKEKNSTSSAYNAEQKDEGKKLSLLVIPNDQELDNEAQDWAQQAYICPTLRF